MQNRRLRSRKRQKCSTLQKRSFFGLGRSGGFFILTPLLFLPKLIDSRRLPEVFHAPSVF